MTCLILKFPAHITLDLSNEPRRLTPYWVDTFLKLQNSCLRLAPEEKTSTFARAKDRFLTRVLGVRKSKFPTTLRFGPAALPLIRVSDSTKKNKRVYWTRRWNVKIKHAPILSETERSRFWSKFDLIFLRKEKIYTKLKYSRTPQYDMVSGGAAALFAGFLGFLISEKFGFELVDSGDFYFLFMYVVLICFFIRTIFKLISVKTPMLSIFSPNWALSFVKSLVMILRNFFFKLLK